MRDQHRRVRADVHGFETPVACRFEPGPIFGQRIGVADFGIDRHVESEQHRVGRSGSLVIGDHVDDRDTAARTQSVVEVAKQCARRGFAFRMDDIVQDCDA